MTRFNLGIARLDDKAISRKTFVKNDATWYGARCSMPNLRWTEDKNRMLDAEFPDDRINAELNAMGSVDDVKARLKDEEAANAAVAEMENTWRMNQELDVAGFAAAKKDHSDAESQRAREDKVIEVITATEEERRNLDRNCAVFQYLEDHLREYIQEGYVSPDVNSEDAIGELEKVVEEKGSAGESGTQDVLRLENAIIRLKELIDSGTVSRELPIEILPNELSRMRNELLARKHEIDSQGA